MGTTRLQLYNDALLLCGERALSSLTENVETRRLLDQVWNNGGVDGCLEEGQWVFAMRTVRIDYDPSVEPDYGYTRAFAKPSDWVLTSGLCSDEFFQTPLTRYFDEAGYWYSDLDILYVRYVSNDASYGSDLSAWPQSFTEFAAAHFASKIILKLAGGTEKLKLFINLDRPERSIRGRALLKAKSRSAMASATSFPARGAWVNARVRGTGGDGGSNTGDLY